MISSGVISFATIVQNTDPRVKVVAKNLKKQKSILNVNYFPWPKVLSKNSFDLSGCNSNLVHNCEKEKNKIKKAYFSLGAIHKPHRPIFPIL